MSRFHINKNGEVKPCRAKKACPLGMAIAGENAKEELKEHLENQWTEDGKWESYIAIGREYTEDEAVQRGEFVNKTVGMLVLNEQTTEHLHKDPRTGTYTEERIKQHDEILKSFHSKFENIPSDGKVIFSAGLPGAGKTTVLGMLGEENKDLDMSNYAFVSSDDFKEEFAKRGMIPEVDGLTPMEASTLTHEESSYLADRFLKELSDKKKNIIYDFTCKKYDSTAERINTLKESGYQEKDMQFVFVDIPIDVAEKRTIKRYTSGLNRTVKENGYGIGGRYLPKDVLYDNKSRTGNFSSRNAEALLSVYETFKVNNMPEPIVYDNSGDNRVDKDYKPKRISFSIFKSIKKRSA